MKMWIPRILSDYAEIARWMIEASCRTCFGTPLRTINAKQSAIKARSKRQKGSLEASCRTCFGTPQRTDNIKKRGIYGILKQVQDDALISIITYRKL
jgi:hypothetical protein